MRLIDADKLFDDFCPTDECLDCVPGNYGCEYCGALSFVEIREVIKDAPTVAMAKRGRWKRTELGHYSCSRCGGEPYYGGDIYDYKFCPFCGAMM